MNAESASGVLQRLATSIDLGERRRIAERLSRVEGAAQLFHLDADRGIKAPTVDPLPVCLDDEQAVLLEAGLAQRMRLAEAIVRDCYGEQRLLREGLLPAELVYASQAYIRSCRSIPPERWITLQSFTLGFADGAPQPFSVLASNAGAVAGVGEALMVRSITARTMPEAYDALAPAGHDDWLRWFRQSLSLLTPPHRPSPRVVVLADSYSDSYIEQSYMAMRLGYHIAEDGDLAVRAGRLWLRSLGQLEPVDVVVRGVASSCADPLEMPRHVDGVPALAMAIRAGTCGMANALGSELATDPLFDTHLGVLCDALLGEPLRLPPASGPSAALYVTAFMVHTDDGPRLLPGGFANGADRRIRDVWIVGRPTAEPSRAPSEPLPQVDLRGSVPARVAESLYWLGRGVERSETAARVLQSVATLSSVASTPIITGLVDVLARTNHITPPDAAKGDDPLAAWPSILSSSLLATTSSARIARAFLSATAWRIVSRLDGTREVCEQLTASTPRIVLTETVDDLLLDLLAFAGASIESVVRGPAWSFLDLGRRLERALLTLGLVESVATALDDEIGAASETLLSSCDSLIAYRRRYRSDFRSQAVVELLLSDSTNPRAVTFQVEAMRAHQRTWPRPPTDTESQLLDDALEALLSTRDDLLGGLLRARGCLLAYADGIAARWFSHSELPESILGHR